MLYEFFWIIINFLYTYRCIVNALDKIISWKYNYDNNIGETEANLFANEI